MFWVHHRLKNQRLNMGIIATVSPPRESEFINASLVAVGEVWLLASRGLGTLAIGAEICFRTP